MLNRLQQESERHKAQGGELGAEKLMKMVRMTEPPSLRRQNVFLVLCITWHQY